MDDTTREPKLLLIVQFIQIYCGAVTAMLPLCLCTSASPLFWLGAAPSLDGTGGIRPLSAWLVVASCLVTVSGIALCWRAAVVASRRTPGAYRWARAAALWMVCFGWPLLLPAGIGAWMLTALARPEVREHFGMPNVAGRAPRS